MRRAVRYNIEVIDNATPERAKRRRGFRASPPSFLYFFLCQIRGTGSNDTMIGFILMVCAVRFSSSAILSSARWALSGRA